MADIGIQFSNNASSSSCSGGKKYVNLEQIGQTDMDKTASMFDINQMITAAKGGVSASTYIRSDCTAYLAGQSIVIDLPFYEWPSRKDLLYSTSASIGKLAQPIIVNDYCEFSLLFEMSRSSSINFLLDEIHTTNWETPCIDKYGKLVDPPELYIPEDNGSVVCADSEIFGVVRIKGRKWGKKRTLQIILPKEDIKYSNIQASITVDWGDKTTTADDADTTTTEQLDIPQCVIDMLSSCDTLEDSLNLLFNSGGTVTVCEKQAGNKIGYYSTCTGDIIEVVNGESFTWCNND